MLRLLSETRHDQYPDSKQTDKKLYSTSQPLQRICSCKKQYTLGLEKFGRYGLQVDFFGADVYKEPAPIAFRSFFFFFRSIQFIQCSYYSRRSHQHTRPYLETRLYEPLLVPTLKRRNPIRFRDAHESSPQGASNPVGSQHVVTLLNCPADGFPSKSRSPRATAQNSQTAQQDKRPGCGLLIAAIQITDASFIKRSSFLVL